MPDPLSTAAAVVGIAVPALHGTRLLLNDIQKIAAAPKAVANLKEDLLSVDMALEALKAVQDSEWESLGQDVAKESKFAVSTCARACDSFRNDLQRWTRHSEDGTLSWQDRANMGFFKQHRIKSLSGQLQNCKITINAAVSIATLYSSIRHTHITEEIKSTIMTKETDITGAIVARDKQVVEVTNRLQDLTVADSAQEGDDAAEEKAEVLKQIEEEQAALNASRKVLKGLLSKTQERTGISVTNVRMSEGGQVLSGLVNTQGRYTNSSVTIDNIEATSGGRGIAGIVEGVNLDNFFK